LGSGNAHRSSSIKSVLDSIKGSNPSSRCVVSSGKSFVTSLDSNNYYTPFSNLRLKHSQVELHLF
jgi:hypothetical protein